MTISQEQILLPVGIPQNMYVKESIINIEQLKAGDVTIVKGPEYHENGVFTWIMDPAGNKLELWEPMAWDDKNKK